ncbi:MAG: hypothetical protein LBP56_01355 [Odoribacteraceae bacterium]|jgi:hypothetical protein|nr:hypothetical protein [Odoribacteraceae bacterium]
MKQFKRYLYLAAVALLAAACSKDSSSPGSGGYADGGGSGSGIGGSMARFTVHGDHLYTVENDKMKVFDISIPDKPYRLPSKDQTLDAGAETIFTLDTLLFIGSQSGMYIYNISRPEFPVRLSLTLHIKSCDPVVASGKYAYVTLNSNSSWCGRTSNLLQVYDISDPRSPSKVTELPLEGPRGLGIAGDTLFVCDNGIKVYDVRNPRTPTWIDDLDHIREIAGIRAYDVIPLEKTLLVIGEDGLYQLDHTGPRLTFISKIAVKRD